MSAIDDVRPMDKFSQIRWFVAKLFAGDVANELGATAVGGVKKMERVAGSLKVVGIGGAPGEGVKVKAGASGIEPLNVRDGMGWFRMNIDKGNQSVGGVDMSVIGDMAVKDTTTVYTVVRRSMSTPMKRRTDSNGALWLVVGTDSGFEGLTEVYYAAIRARLQPQ